MLVPHLHLLKLLSQVLGLPPSLELHLEPQWVVQEEQELVATANHINPISMSAPILFEIWVLEKTLSLEQAPWRRMNPIMTWGCSRAIKLTFRSTPARIESIRIASLTSTTLSVGFFTTDWTAALPPVFPFETSVSTNAQISNSMENFTDSKQIATSSCLNVTLYQSNISYRE